MGDLAPGGSVVGLHGGVADLAQAEGLSRRKIGQETIQPDNEQTRGKIAKIGYLLEVTEVE